MKLKISDYNFNGAVSKEKGKVNFVNKALLNEVVDVHIVSEKKNYNICKIDKVLKKSDKRQKSFCRYANLCDGCNLDICSYTDTLLIKKKCLEDLFKFNKLNISNFVIEENKNPIYYRNKISVKVVDGHIGYQEKETNCFFPIEKCLLAKDCINQLLKDFACYAFLNGTMVIRANYNDELLLIINTSDKVNIEEKLFSNHKIAGIIINDKCVYLNSFFYERLGNILYKVNYDAFFQVNNYISEIISQDVMALLNQDDTVLDLYCGVGYFSLKMAKKVKEVIGIEINAHAIMDALTNKKLNHLENVNFLLGKVEDKVSKLKKEFSKIVIDPPRSGLDKKTLSFLLNSNVLTIIYISCNPVSLVRDLKKLQTKYNLLKIKGYDMFSYTYHVECVCVLKLR